MVAVLVMAIIAAMVVAGGASADGGRLRAAAQRLAADLRYAQNLAVTHQENVTVTFDLAQESYSLSDSDGTLTHPVEHGDYEVAFDTRPYDDVVITSAFGGGGSVTFDETGTPDAGGSVVLTMGSSSYTIEVKAITGMVTSTRN